MPIYSNSRYSWADVEVGDLMIISQDEIFPCDIAVLGSEIESGRSFSLY
jgi:magnesium-transporting ATPase (P-type)